MEKVLSVSIAAYNVAQTLDEALMPFLQCKSLASLDIMIVDDGSSDKTADIAQIYVEKYPDSFRLIKKQNGGWGSTLNVGIRMATGKYFKQLDGDDLFSAENLDDFVSYLADCHTDIVYSPFLLFEDQSRGIIREIGQYDLYPQRREMRMKEMLHFLPAMHTLTVKTDVLKLNHIQITEHCFYTDVEFVLKSCNVCKTLSFYEYPIYFYRIARSGQSMSIQGVRKHYLDHVTMLTGMLQYEIENVHSSHMKQMFRERLLQACKMQYSFFFALPCTRKQKEELKQFDRLLRVKYPYYYNRILGRPVWFLRHSDFRGYWLIGHLKTKKDKKLKINIFEGC